MHGASIEDRDAFRSSRYKEISSTMQSPQPTPRPFASPPSIRCSCKVSRCPLPECLRCSRCGCEHDNVPMAQKMQRRRGKPKVTKPAPEMQTPVRRVKIRPDYRHSKTPTPTPKQPQLPKWTHLLSLFGFSEAAVNEFARHVPSRSVRWKPEFWDPSQPEYEANSKTRATILRVYKAVIYRIAETLCGEEAAPSSVQAFVASQLKAVNTKSAYEPIISGGLQAIAATRKGSMERRLVRAMMCGLFELNQLRDVEIAPQGCRIGHTTYSKSSEEFEILQEEGKLQSGTFTRRKFDAGIVDQAIQVIFSSANASYLSWGTKRIFLHGTRHDVPLVLLKRAKSVIYNDYKSRLSIRHLSKSSFYKLCGVLSGEEVQSRTAVDYVTGVLVNEPFALLGKIFDRVLPELSDGLKADLDVIKAWLKYGHARHEEPSSAELCARHDAEFALSSPSADERIVTCDCCRALHRFFVMVTGHLRDRITSPATQQAVQPLGASDGQVYPSLDGLEGHDELFYDEYDGELLTLQRTTPHVPNVGPIHPSAATVLPDILQKIYLYMAHRVRVINQQHEIARMIDEAQGECRRDRRSDLAVLLIDFKMKAEPKYHRETMTAHFGKRGISWHGVLVRTWKVVEGGDDEELHLDETRVYYDQLASTDNKQDKGAVISLIEATMIALRRDFPHIKRVIIQSDNASCYQNACVILLLPIIGAAHGIQVERYEHTETQDGKSSLDAHFAQAQRKVYRFVQEGNDSVTPTQYLYALGSNGGLPNCRAELVVYNRANLTKLLEQLSPMERAFNKLHGRSNSIFYSYPTTRHPSDPDQPFNLNSTPDYTVSVFAYGGIGRAVQIRVSPSRRTCEPIGEALSREEQAELADPSRHGVDDVSWHDVGAMLYLSEASDNECSAEEDEEASESDLEEDESILRSHQHKISASITHVRVTDKSEMRRRARRWRHTAISTEEEAPQHARAVVQERNLLAYAKTKLLTLADAGRIELVNAHGLGQRVVAIGEGLDSDLDRNPLPVLKRGWARRPQVGKMYGAKYIHLYQKDVRELFVGGELDKMNKQGAGQMLEALQKKYPERFDLPSESEIRAEISRLFGESRKRKRQTGDADGGSPRRRRRLIPEAFAAFLKQTVEANPTVKPMDAIPLFRAQFPGEDTIDNRQIREKVSALKTTLKSRRNQ